jgi:hypothetical protein
MRLALAALLVLLAVPALYAEEDQAGRVILNCMPRPESGGRIFSAAVVIMPGS